MVVRAPLDDDFPVLAEITSHYIATTAAHFGYDPVTGDDLRDVWRRTRDRFPWWVAEQGGVAVGYAKAGTWRERAAYQWTAEVGVYVADTARGHGIGRALYRELLGELTRAGFHSAVAAITLPNEASVGLHRAFGFRSVGVFEDAGWKHGRWHAIEFWQKPLAAGDAPPPARPA